MNEPLKLSFPWHCYETQKLWRLGKDRLSICAGLVKIVLISRVSSNKYSIGDILEREHLEFSICWVQQIAKLKGRGPTLEEARLDHAIRSSVAITKLLLILTKEKRKIMNNKKNIHTTKLY